MTDPQLLKRSIKLCMFDQYGTVVDMQSGLVASPPFLQAKGWQGSPNTFVTWWRRTHFENSMIDALLGPRTHAVSRIGERAVAFVMDRAGIAHTAHEVRALVAAIERLQPFPEVPAALDRLRGRYKLACCRTAIPTCWRQRRQHLGIAFDHVFSVPSRAPSSRTTRPMKKQQNGRCGARRGTVRRQPRLRLHRRQGDRHAHRLHRPPPPPVRRHAAPARPDRAKHDRTGGDHSVRAAAWDKGDKGYPLPLWEGVGGRGWCSRSAGLYTPLPPTPSPWARVVRQLRIDFLES